MYVCMFVPEAEICKLDGQASESGTMYLEDCPVTGELNFLTPFSVYIDTSIYIQDKVPLGA